jgi:hypothetical protein
MKSGTEQQDIELARVSQKVFGKARRGEEFDVSCPAYWGSAAITSIETA